MIFVTGAGGTVSRHLVAALRAYDAPFRAGCRSAVSLSRAQSAGVDAVRIDFDQPNTLRRAFEGATRLFLLAGNGERQLRQELTAVEAAQNAGVRTIVKLSAWRAPEREYSFARLHREIECAVESSGLAWTFLRPCGFMQNFSGAMARSIRMHGEIRLAAGDARVSHIDVRDVAEIAARVLTRPGHAGRAYALSGPSALSYDEAARILADVLGRPVRYVDLSEAQARDEMLAAGLSPSYTEEVLDLFRAYRQGRGSAVTDDVEALLGRPPIGFERFVRDHEGDFR